MHPEAGRLTYLRDARRRPLWIDPAGYEPAADGGPVRLSVDLVIQQLAEERLRAAVLEFNAGGGRVVVMDCETGELLAMHDLVNPRAGWDEQIGDPLRLRDPALGRNRCVTDPYEPGSTFKPFIWSTVTHLGRASMDEVLPTPAAGVHRTPYGRRITDAHAMADATWREVLIHSMNSGMAIAAERLSHREMQHAVAAFCFGERTGSGLPGESAGIVTTAAEWSAYTQTSVAMGYEIAVTPLQMVRAFSAFARDGTIPTPRFTAVTGAEREYRFLRRATPESVAITTRGVMREVMTQGTGRRVSSRRYTIFGKSGTAHLARRNEPGYHEDRYVSSFIAGAPFHEPRIVVLCVIDDPDRSLGHFGGTVAGPVVRDVIDGALEYLGVPPDRDGAM